MGEPSEPQTLFADLAPGVQFIKSERVEAVARRLVATQTDFELSGLRQALAANLSMLFLENVKPFDQALELPVCGVFSKAIKASPVWRDLTGADAVLWIRSIVCDAKSWPALLEAQVFHALLHFECAFVSPEWRLALRPHDVQAFNETAGRYADGLPDVKAFLRAAAPFFGTGPAEGEQNVPPASGW